MKKYFILCCIFLLFGCSPGLKLICQPNTPGEKINNEFFEAYFSPADVRSLEIEGDFKGFLLTIYNKSKKDLELIWDKTLFIQDGETKGGFMFEGIVYTERNNPKPPDIIFANSTYKKIIYPNVFVSYGSYISAWLHDNIGAGNYGIYLTVKVDGKEINEKMFLDCHTVANK